MTIGTMIETPRAALRAAEIAEVADFFSFGTNDLTQMTFGFSRDDVEGRMMDAYLELGLLPRNPFEVVDLGGVGELVSLGTERGRATRPALKVGVCGEHGGDPASIGLFYDAGLDYVSCSPFRVPVARLAAAQAVLAQGPRQAADQGKRVGWTRRPGGRPATVVAGQGRLSPAEASTPGRGTVSAWGYRTRRWPRSGRPPTSSPSSASTPRSRRSAGAGAGCAPSTPRRRPRSASTPRRASTTASAARRRATPSRSSRAMDHLDFVDAVRFLADRAGITLHEDQEAGRDHKRRSELLEAMERAVAVVPRAPAALARRRPRPATTCAPAATTGRSCASSAWAGRPTTGTPWPRR